MDWKAECYALKYPIEFLGAPVTSITIREPTAAALEAIEEIGLGVDKQPNFRQLRLVIAALADVDPAVIGRLHRSDFSALIEITVPFFIEAAGASIQ